MKIVFTGGGSGGHTMTALAVLNELESRHPGISEDIVFLGGSLTMEGEKGKPSLEESVFTERGIKFVKIRSGKLQRSFSLNSLKLLGGVIAGFGDAWKFFKKNSVDFVFSTGGYVAVPVCIVGWLKKVPVIIHEQTTRVGLANSISARFAKKILLGFEESRKFFPSRKCVFTGNAVRSCFFDPDCWPEDEKKRMKKFKSRSDQFPVLLIAGGGQGSHLINKTVKAILKTLLGSFQLIILTGDNQINKDYEMLERESRKLQSKLKDRLIIKRFAGNELGAYMDAANLFIGRAGALSVYETGVTKTPSIFIPIPWVTHNEQYNNAKAMKDLGLAMILPEGELSPEVLLSKIDQMISKISQGSLVYDEMNLNKRFIKDAVSTIADELNPFINL